MPNGEVEVVVALVPSVLSFFSPVALHQSVGQHSPKSEGLAVHKEGNNEGCELR